MEACDKSERVWHKEQCWGRSEERPSSLERHGKYPGQGGFELDLARKREGQLQKETSICKGASQDSRGWNLGFGEVRVEPLVRS